MRAVVVALLIGLAGCAASPGAPIAASRSVETAPPIGCDGPRERIEALASIRDATSPLRVRNTLLAATASQQLGDWSAAADRWAELTRMEPAHLRWTPLLLDALVKARRWSELCPLITAHVAAPRAASATVAASRTSWIDPLHTGAIDDGSPDAIAAARCADDALQASPWREPPARLRRLRALLTCAEGDRAAAVAELDAVGTSTQTWGVDANNDATRIRAGRSCGTPGPLETPQRAPAGTIGKDEVGAVIKQSRPRFKSCFEQALAKNPELRGRVVIHFVIGPGGGVQRTLVEGTTMDEPETEQCAARVMSTRTFAAHKGRGQVVVSYPFVYCTQ